MLGVTPLDRKELLVPSFSVFPFPPQGHQTPSLHSFLLSAP